MDADYLGLGTTLGPGISVCPHSALPWLDDLPTTSVSADEHRSTHHPQPRTSLTSYSSRRPRRDDHIPRWSPRLRQVDSAAPRAASPVGHPSAGSLESNWLIPSECCAFGQCPARTDHSDRRISFVRSRSSSCIVSFATLAILTTRTLKLLPSRPLDRKSVV